jgi:cytochrome P450 family 619
MLTLRLTSDYANNVFQWLEAIEPGANPPIDVFPWLWYFPGKWKKRAYETRSLMDKLWSDARTKVDERRARGDIRDAMIDRKLDEYNKTGWKMSQHAFNTMFGELLEAGADSEFSTKHKSYAQLVSRSNEVQQLQICS